MSNRMSMLSVVLMNVFVCFGESFDYASLTNGESVTSCLAHFPYPGTNISSFAECDFEERLQVTAAILSRKELGASTNVLYSIADYLSLGAPIPVGSFQTDILAAHREDRLAEFGNSNYVVRAGSAYFGPKARVCRQRYEYWRTYNSRLIDFRKSVLKKVYQELSSRSWSHIAPAERNLIWSEFRRRANSSESEIGGLPLTFE